MTIYYAIALLVAFYLLFIAEFFLPTGGLLGTAAVAVLVAAIVIAFSHSLVGGVGLLLFVLVTTPLVIFGMLQAWPHTPIGRRMLNRRPGQLAGTPPKRTTSRGTPLEQLIGRVGSAKTNLLPSGMVSIDGESIDAVSIGMPIDAGTKVVVTSIDVGRVHVRTATPEDLTTQPPPVPQSPAALEESLDSLDVD